MSSREQLFNTIASDRCDDAQLGKMGADRIDHRGLLADKEVTGDGSIRQTRIRSASPRSSDFGRARLNFVFLPWHRNRH
jgi:hypothetical protein